jgi:hypothetical protein
LMIQKNTVISGTLFNICRPIEVAGRDCAIAAVVMAGTVGRLPWKTPDRPLKVR